MSYKFSFLAIGLILLSISELTLSGSGSANATEISITEINTVSTSKSLDTEDIDVVNHRSIEPPESLSSELSTPVAINPQPAATDLDWEGNPFEPISNPVLSLEQSNSALIQKVESDPARIWAIAKVSPLSDFSPINDLSLVKPTGTTIAQTPEAPVPTAEVLVPSPQTEPKKWSVGVHAQASTTGLIGVDAGYKFSPNLHVRIGLNTVGFSTSYSSQGIDYNASINPTNIHLLGDYFPFGSGLRLTGGFVIQNNRFTGSSRSNASNQINLNGVDYNASQVGTVESEGSFSNSIAPYLGIGFGTPISSGFGFNIDAGIMFAGSPKVVLSANNLSSSIPISVQNQIRSDLAAQQQRTNADISSFNLYPVLSIGFSYAF